MSYTKISNLVLFLTIFIFTSSIFAQSDSTKQLKTKLKNGSWSMQFGYNNNLGFNSFKGGNISAKYHFTDNNALRFGVNLKFFNKNDKRNSGTQPDNNFVFLDGTQNSITIDFFTDYVHYFSTKKTVNFYIASGPFVGIGYSNTQVKSSFGNIDSVSTIGFSKTNSWFVGAAFSIGVEWFVTSNFSLHGEYVTKIKYEYSKQVNNATNFDYRHNVEYSERILNMFSFSPDNVLIGVSLYF